MIRVGKLDDFLKNKLIKSIFSFKSDLLDLNQVDDHQVSDFLKIISKFYYKLANLIHIFLFKIFCSYDQIHTNLLQ